MPTIDSEDKFYRRAGSVGFPEEQPLEAVIHDGKRIKKKAQLIVVHHKTKGVRYKLNVDEYVVKKDGSQSRKSHIPLGEDATERLFEYLLSRENFANIAQTTFYTVVESIAPLDKQTVEQIARLLRRALRNRQLDEILPSDIVGNFTAVVHQIRYKKSIKELKKMFNKKHTEKDYEIWFLNNHWIFGTEYLGVEKVKIAWKKEGDIILTSTDGYQDIIELKLPSETVLLYDSSHKDWYPSAALSKAITQGITYIQESEDARTIIRAKEKLPFLKPRAKIVIGRSEDWNSDKQDSLRKLNSSLQNIQIMTYDHLLASANRMIDYYERGVGYKVTGKVTEGEKTPSEGIVAKQVVVEKTESDDTPF